jgi:hypothetical protein
MFECIWGNLKLLFYQDLLLKMVSITKRLKWIMGAAKIELYGITSNK